MTDKNMIDKNLIDKNKVTLQIADLPFTLELQTHGESDLVSRIILQDKIWEAFETKLVIENLHDDAVFIDVGANIGYYSVISSKCVGNNGKVFAFEPEQKNFQLLEQNIKLNALNNVQCFQAGLGKRNHEIDFFINTENRGDHRAFNKEKNREKTSINILVGDEVLQNKKVDFIKIDTQGYELAILQGFQNTIAANQQYLKMIIEFWPFALKENGHSADELLNELARYDFEIYIIDHIHHQLVKTDIETLRNFTETSLTAENQGFINLFLKSASF